MRTLLLVLLIVPVSIASAGDPVKSRWRSMTTGDLFEVTDYGDRLSIRFLGAEVVEDQTAESADIAVNMNGPRQRLIPGRWLLEKREDGKYVGTTNSQMTCTYYRQWYTEWRTNVCKLSGAVELTMTGTEVSGWRDGPADQASFNCGKCRYSKSARTPLNWILEEPSGATQAMSAPPVGAAPESPASASVGTKEPGVYKIESVPPGAEVYIDGDFVGSTPIAKYSLAIGKHEIEIRKKGFSPWIRQLSVSAGAQATVAAEMEP